MRLGIGAYGDNLFKIARIASLAVVGDGDFALGTRRDRLLRIRWHCAAAGGYGLIDDEGSIADIGKCELTGDDALGFGEGAKIVDSSIKFNLAQGCVPIDTCKCKKGNEDGQYTSHIVKSLCF